MNGRGVERRVELVVEVAAVGNAEFSRLGVVGTCSFDVRVESAQAVLLTQVRDDGAPLVALSVHASIRRVAARLLHGRHVVFGHAERVRDHVVGGGDILVAVEDVQGGVVGNLVGRRHGLRARSRSRSRPQTKKVA